MFQNVPFTAASWSNNEAVRNVLTKTSSTAPHPGQLPPGPKAQHLSGDMLTPPTPHPHPPLPFTLAGWLLDLNFTLSKKYIEF